jgi:hypothetical protein
MLVFHFSGFSLYSAFTDKLKLNWHLAAPSRNCVTHSQELQDFPNMSQALLHKKNKINSPILWGAENELASDSCMNTCTVL